MHYTRFLVFVLLLVALAAPQPARAQAKTIIRDTEIETYMKEWFEPVFRAAGMNGDQVNVILVQDPAINAFVAGGANIFLYTGLIQKTDNPGELIGVVAHELGHIAGGHLIRGREAMKNASYESILGAILGIGTAIVSGNASAAGAISSGASAMAQRRFLSTSRTYESSADQAALRYLNQAGLNPTGLKTFMQKLESEELVPANRQSEYVQTHPLTRNRVMALEDGVAQSAARDKPYPAEWLAQHERMKAKILGFINPGQVPWVYDDRDQSIPAMTARAVAAYRESRMKEALALADKLIAAEPNSPYAHELKGQMLVDFNRVREGMASYEKAVALKPDAPLIRLALAHAQLESAGENKAQIGKAIDNLKRAQKEEPRATLPHRLLATAYGRLGKEPQARLHLAEEALMQGNKDYAKRHAAFAADNLPKNSPEWLRAQDILSFIAQGKK